jgi:predicted ATPase
VDPKIWTGAFSLYWLMPSAGTPRRKGVDWVVIEEPEMELHPQAIQSVPLICLELMQRSYKVVMSTINTLLRRGDIRQDDQSTTNTII